MHVGQVGREIKSPVEMRDCTEQEARPKKCSEKEEDAINDSLETYGSMRCRLP